MVFKISVIIPVYNDSNGLQDTVKSLINQEHPEGKYEIIIIDNGSQDDTIQIADSFTKEYPNLIKVDVENKIQSSYAARNKGIEVSKGDILCFIDADMTVKPDYLSKIESYFSRKPIDYLGCKVNIYSERNTLTSKFNIAKGFPVRSYLKNSHFVPTCCLSVRKSVIDKVGSFDSRLESGADMEFGQRVYATGFKQIFADNILIEHPARWKYSSLIEKGKRVARGIAQMKYYYPDKYGPLYKKYFTITRYIPTNPIYFFKVYNKNDKKINLWEALWLSLFHIPIRIFAFLELLKEYNKFKCRK